jgi:electron transport complex protein RnfG
MQRINAETQRRRDARDLSWFVASLPLSVFAFFFLIVQARAEKFLGPEEAARVCFPQATAFARESVPISAEDKKRIEKESSVTGVPKQQQVWLARQGTNLVGCLVIDQVVGKHELIDYAVAVSTNGAALQVEILEYREHYGGQVHDAKWRAQFKGKTAQSPLILERDIYNISGATLSCRHVTQGVKRVLVTYERVVRPRLFGAKP